MTAASQNSFSLASLGAAHRITRRVSFWFGCAFRQSVLWIDDVWAGNGRLYGIQRASETQVNLFVKLIDFLRKHKPDLNQT